MPADRQDSFTSVGTRAPSWLCPTEFDRARLLDMTRRLLPATLLVAAVCGPTTFSLASRTGPSLLITFAVIMVFVGATSLFAHRRTPENWLFLSDCVVVGSIASAAAMTGGSSSPALPSVFIPLVAVAGRHTKRGLSVFFPITVSATLLACVFAVHPRAHLDDLRLPALMSVMTSLFIVMLALMRADSEHHRESLVDPLTGLLNRLALSRKLRELASQAVSSRGSLCVIAADIDHFKRINDTYGHAMGDSVLKAVAAELRDGLRAFSLLYRTGGEEFAIVLPGMDSIEGQAIAERLRTAIEAGAPGGMRVTLSFGVAVTSGAGIDPDRALLLADQLLYAAKRKGRNCVAAETEPGYAADTRPRAAVLATSTG